MRRLATTLLLGALLAGAGLVVATPAAACSCAPIPAAEQFSRADIAFTGRLVSRTVERPGGEISSSLDPAVHVFAVEDVFKGAVGERQEVVSADSGASCGLELAGEGPFVVFATETSVDGERQYVSGLCDGTGFATPELEAQLTDLAGPPVVPGGDAGEDPGEPTIGPAAELGPGPTVRVADTRSGVSVPVVAAAAAGALALGLVGLVFVRRARRRTGPSGDTGPGSPISRSAPVRISPTSSATAPRPTPQALYPSS